MEWFQTKTCFQFNFFTKQVGILINVHISAMETGI